MRQDIRVLPFLNIPVDELRERLGELDKSKSVYVICQSGLRSYIASRILEGNGFTAYNFSGGYRFYDILSIKDLTSIVVTHRLDETVLKQYDKIIVLHNGKVEECDTFEKLLERKGYFYSLYTVSQ